jgi:hypothetical protein
MDNKIEEILDDIENFFLTARDEPYRDARGLQSLRGWRHEQTNEIFPGGSGTVGGDGLDCGEDRLHDIDIAEMGAPGRA